MPKGRKRKAGVQRHPGGRIVQAGPRAEDPRMPAILKRMAAHNLSKTAAAEQESGSAIGRLKRTGEITPKQYEAALEYARVKDAAWFAYDAKRPRSASDYGGAGGYDGRDGTDALYVEKCQRSIEREKETERALAEADHTGRASKALELWVLYDFPDAGKPERELLNAWLGDLRVGLNALARLYRVDDWTPPQEAS